MNIGAYCKKYRDDNLRTVKDIANGETSISTLYSFEYGQSNNFNHVALYIKFAISIGDEQNFMAGLIKEVSANV